MGAFLIDKNISESNEYEITLSSQLEIVLYDAINQARTLGHRFIGTGHLLLGLVDTDSKSSNLIFKKLKISPDLIKEEILLLYSDKK